VIYHFPILYSDHAPILEILQGSNQQRKKPFRFENWWILENDFQELASKTWQDTQNKLFHSRTSTLAKNLKFWSKKKKPIHEQLSNIERTSPTYNLCIQAKETIVKNKPSPSSTTTYYKNRQNIISKCTRSYGYQRPIETPSYSTNQFSKDIEKLESTSWSISKAIKRQPPKT
jgi:hypothetical protein